MSIQNQDVRTARLFFFHMTLW